MYIDSLRLKNFRNYEDMSAALSPGVNIIMGKNAQGKTNLVESVYYMCVGKSPRTPRDKELIRWQTEQAYIRLNAVKSTGNIRLEAYLTRTENKRISINSIPISRMGELMGAVNAVFFSPDEIRIVKESPSDRRRFVDIDLSQISKAYFYNLSRYNKILYQRNKLLKSGKNLSDTLYIWDVQLAETGAKIALARKNFLSRIAVHAQAAHHYLTDTGETLTVEYEGITGETETELKDNFMAQLEKSRPKDILHGYTGAGIHKDDISLSINGTDIRTYGSQGQQRTTALSLKLAELEVFAEECGEYPVLILDDVLSELDIERQTRLLSHLKTQTIITCTHMEVKPPCARVFYIREGLIADFSDT